MCRAAGGGRSAVVFLLFTVASAVGAQERYPIFTSDHLDRTMKTVGPNVAAARRSLAAADFEQAKAQLVRSREQLATTITFWRDRGREDAVALLRESIATLDGLDDALSADPVDPAAVASLSDALGATCQACHDVYREQDPVTLAYRLKTGID